jgi:uncharacterized repeat protein (TIGR01451 family)
VTPTTLSLSSGGSANVAYTISGTRSQTGTTATYTVSGNIVVTNNSGAGQQVTAVDQAQTSAGSARGAPLASTQTVAANSSATIPYTVTFSSGAGDTDTTTYRNHVDVFAGSATSGTALASADKDITGVVSSTSSVGTTATVTDSLTCPVGLTCGTPTNFTGDGTAPSGGSPANAIRVVTDSFTFSYQRSIASSSACGGSPSTVSDTATLTPGDGSVQQPPTDSASVTVTPGPCLTATKTAKGRHTRVYDWALQKTASPALAQVSKGFPTPISYTLTATRTKTSDTFAAEGQICVTNHGTTDATGVSAVDHVSPGESPPGSPIANTTVTIGTVPAGMQKCASYKLAFTPAAGVTRYTNSADVTSDNAGTATVSTGFGRDDIADAKDGGATVADTLTCAQGFTCGSATTSFPKTLPLNPTTANANPDALYTDKIPYTRTLTNTLGCGASGTIGNSATLTESDTGQSHPATANVTASAPSSVCTGPDLLLTKLGPDTVARGDQITWNLSVGNLSFTQATGVVLTDALPGGTSFVSATASQGTCSGSATVSCSLGKLSIGGFAAVTIVATANVAGTVTNTATVLGAQTDPNPGDNTASATTIVTPKAGGGGGGGGGAGGGGAGGGGAGGGGGDGSCRLQVQAPGFYVGIRTNVTVTVTQNDGTPVANSTVRIAGKGGIHAASSPTDANGQATFVVHATQPKASFTVATDKCGSKKIVAHAPSPDCSGLSVAPKQLAVAQPVTITIQLHLHGQPVTGVKVAVKGPGLSASGVTNPDGLVRLRVAPKKSGIFRITVPGVLACTRQAVAQVK